MKISLRWLADYVDVPWDVPTLTRKLAMLGLPVESVTELGGQFSGVIVAEVREKAPHPKAEKLTLVKVWDGEGIHDVVCGAANVPEPGGKVLWARPGSKLPGGLEIGSKELRGVKSAGMLASESELGLAEGKSEGIVVLTGEDAAALPGTLAQDALDLRDTVLDVELTPNRGDCLSHLGIAREIAALTGGAVRLPATELDGFLSDRDASAQISVLVDDADGCPRYTARVIDGLTVKPSPRWMRRRLEAVGVRSISNLVDVTNYVLFELGQPTHAFDAAKLRGAKIQVRRAKAGEKLTTLDGQERTLEAGDLLICDGAGPVALGGVMGGAGSEVDATTKSILLEAATFEATSVRRVARRLGLHSEASHRYERGIDQNAIDRNSRRVARLLAELGGGKVARGLVDVEAKPRKPAKIALRPARFEQLMGFAVPAEQMVKTLAGLAIEAKLVGETIQCTPPAFRLDLELEVDLIEEVARLTGYEHIPVTLPLTQARPKASGDPIGEAARDALTGAGLDEAILFGFTGTNRLAALRFPGGHPATRPVPLKNPLREEQSVMRTSLMANLLAAVSANLRNGQPDVRIFEVGSVFLPSGTVLPDEVRHVAGVITGERRGWLTGAGSVDFADVRGVVERLFDALRLPIDFVPARNEDGFLHPGVAASIVQGDHVVGVVGEVHPETRDRAGIEKVAFAFEIDLSRLPIPPRATFSQLPRFPATSRDVSFFVDDYLPAARVRTIVEAAKEPLLVDLRVLEDYREAGRVPPGKKGMLWSMTYRALDRTLTDAEVDTAHEKIVTHLLGSLGPQASRR